MKKSTIFRLKVAGMAFVLSSILVQVANTGQMPQGGQQGGQQAPAGGSRFSMPSMSSLNPFAPKPPTGGGQPQSSGFNPMAMIPQGMRPQGGQSAPGGTGMPGGFPNPIAMGQGMMPQGMRPQAGQGVPGARQMPSMPQGMMPQMGGSGDLSKITAALAELRSMLNGIIQRVDAINQKQDNTGQILGQIMQMEQADMQSDAQLSATVQEIAADVDALAADGGANDTGGYAQQPSGGYVPGQ